MTSNRKASPEETLSSRTIHQGRSFSFVSDQVRLPDGRTVQRDYVRYPEAVVILPLLDETQLLLIEQYRHALGEMILELPAGKIEAGETDLAAAAQRELREETGYSARQLDYQFTYYPAVGYSSEKIHVFYATALYTDPASPDEDEFITLLSLPLSQAEQMLERQEIKDGKTVLVLNHFFRKMSGGRK